MAIRTYALRSIFQLNLEVLLLDYLYWGDYSKILITNHAGVHSILALLDAKGQATA